MKCCLSKYNALNPEIPKARPIRIDITPETNRSVHTAGEHLYISQISSPLATIMSKYIMQNKYTLIIRRMETMVIILIHLLF